MVAGITFRVAAAILAAFFTATASADNSPQIYDGRIPATHPQVTSIPGMPLPPRVQVSPAAPEVTSPRQAAAARPRVESEPSPFTLAKVGPVALLVFVTVLGLVMTLRSLRKDIKNRRVVYRQRMHRNRSHP